MRRIMFLLTAIVCVALSARLTAAPRAEAFMLAGKLAEGEQSLQQHLKAHPEDDEARFGLGAIQFLLTFEHLGTSLHKYGLRTERGAPLVGRQLSEIVPQNPDPQPIRYQDSRRIVERFVKDLAAAEATLAKVDGESVKLPLHVGLIKIDVCGLGKPVSAAFVLGRIDVDVPEAMVQQFVVCFDRGDVDWLRGYCHLLSACGEILLAVDAQEVFDCTAHMFFERVTSPHKFLQEEPRVWDDIFSLNARVISDLISFSHLMRFPMKEPHRMKRAHAHLRATLASSRTMWKHYQAETDDENEWIPNPSQTGAMQIEVSDEMVATWLRAIKESEAVLEGKKLIPFWRGEDPTRGVNLRRVFLEPRALDPILWIQGTAATPYLEQGEITNFAEPRTLQQINNTFGGWNFFGFAFWFN